MLPPDVNVAMSYAPFSSEVLLLAILPAAVMADGVGYVEYLDAAVVLNEATAA